MFDGTKETPNVRMSEHLLMAEGDAALPASLQANAVRLTSAGLDKSSANRSIVVVPEGALTASMIDMPGVRVLKPITPKIRK